MSAKPGKRTIAAQCDNSGNLIISVTHGDNGPQIVVIPKSDVEQALELISNALERHITAQPTPLVNGPAGLDFASSGRCMYCNLKVGVTKHCAGRTLIPGERFPCEADTKLGREISEDHKRRERLKDAGFSRPKKSR